MNILASQVCKIMGHASTVFEDGDWRCSRCGQGFYEVLSKALEVPSNLRYMAGYHKKGGRR